MVPATLFGYTPSEVQKVSGLPLPDATNVVSAFSDGQITEQEKALFVNYNIDSLTQFVNALKANPVTISKSTFSGFTVTDLANYFNVSLGQASAIVKVANKQPLSASDTLQLQEINPSRLKPGASGPNQGFGDIVWGLQHLSEHPAGSHYHGDFNLSFSSWNPLTWWGAVERLFTFTPKSFTPANIVRSGSAGTVGVLTGGTSLTLEGNTVWSPSADKNSIIGSGYVGANSAGFVKGGMDPSTPQTLFERISGFIGTSISAIASGRALGTLKYRMGAPLVGAEGPTNTPLTATQVGANSGIAGLQIGVSGYGYGQAGQAIIGIFGAKLGGFILGLLAGDIQGALSAFNGGGGQTQPGTITTIYRNIANPNGGGGGGGGVPYSDPNTGQTNTYTLLYIALGLGLVALLWFKWRR